MKKIAIIIPARYESTRFPGKPLAFIGHKTMLERVCDLARTAAKNIQDCSILVATDDNRIAEHAKNIGVTSVMTPQSCTTGSERVLAAIQQLEQEPDFVVNLQGDTPLTPPDVVKTLIDTWLENTGLSVITPIIQLSWSGLNKLRENKKSTPFSGTTCIKDNQGYAVWFSKNIIPAIRHEPSLRNSTDLSPIFQHLGLYGFKIDALKKFVTLPNGYYEELEGLEQLRLLENKIPIYTVTVDVKDGMALSGIDSPEDLKRAEKILSCM